MDKLIWKKVQGTQLNKPQTLDTISSPSTVYLRKNITRKEIKSGNNQIEIWEYSESMIPRNVYDHNMMIINEMASLIEQGEADSETYAEMLLNQADTALALSAQDEALADILINIIDKEAI